MIITAEFDVLTYDKGSWPRVAVKETTVDFQAPDGSKHRYQLEEQQIELAVPGQRTTTDQQVRPAGTVTAAVHHPAQPGRPPDPEPHQPESSHHDRSRLPDEATGGGRRTTPHRPERTSP